MNDLNPWGVSYGREGSCPSITRSLAARNAHWRGPQRNSDTASRRWYGVKLASAGYVPGSRSTRGRIVTSWLAAKRAEIVWEMVGSTQSCISTMMSEVLKLGT